ncbi:CBU_0592 family membrane protein [Novosphingobium pituita]|uniref:CBU-0592-like domain-containing protein n=1 Tax=Novosphingobium pituita TaxID=3056842 RepID=A0ABQ6P6S1_9SPHN|nr:hypothetical protein NUTIK01_13520 [Novosphingobium sp. IK01]
MITPVLPPLLADICGFAGMACVILAYGYATYGATRGGAKGPPANPFIQHGTNLAGAALLTVSLLVHLNPASLVLEGFWAAIAIWGLVKAFREKGSKTR